MKRVYSSQVRSTADYVKNILEQQGIPCTVTGEYLGVAIGEIPPIESWPGVWVLDKSDEERALQIISAFEQDEAQHLGVWNCPQCGKQSEGQFDTCWSCGTAKK